MILICDDRSLLDHLQLSRVSKVRKKTIRDQLIGIKMCMKAVRRGIISIEAGL